MKLSDPKLFRQQCYVDGSWVDADGGGAIPVENPANGEKLGTVYIRLQQDWPTFDSYVDAGRALPCSGCRTARGVAPDDPPGRGRLDG